MNNKQFIIDFLSGNIDNYKQFNNLHFDGSALFSYNTIIALKKGDYLLISRNNFSNTTAKHLNIIKTNNPLKALYVPFKYAFQYREKDIINQVQKQFIDDLLSFKGYNLNLKKYRTDFLNLYNDYQRFIAIFDYLPEWKKDIKKIENIKSQVLLIEDKRNGGKN